MSPSRDSTVSSKSPRDLELDLHVHAGGEVELHQRVHGLGRRIDDIQDPFMGALISNCSRDFLSIWGERQHSEFFRSVLATESGRAHGRTRAFGGRRRFHSSIGIQNPMVKRLQADPDVLAVHDLNPWRDSIRGGREAPPIWRSQESRAYRCYSTMAAIRHRRRRCGRLRGWRSAGFSSMAIGDDQARPPSPRCRPASPFPCLPATRTTPVTSVVRK